jgi:4-diphosphocytidyl-2-C-methyl-D-erythritol kinase
MRWWRAPAKINLALHVLQRRPDGFHQLDSLVAFAGVSDWLGFEPKDRLELTVEGPTAAACGSLEGNLVLKAAGALVKRVPDLKIGWFRLIKCLPAAAGLGSGSADAAAALRAIANHNNLKLDDERLLSAAVETGADVPACLHPRARRVTGIGELLGAAVLIPTFFVVLVNPGVASPTRIVFDLLGPPKGTALDQTPKNITVEFLANCSNDLEQPAKRLNPIVGTVLDALAGLPKVKFVRMSGSGATCFALFDDFRHASRARDLIASNHPDWWTQAAVLR